MNTVIKRIVIHFDWSWVGMSFCFFIVFHLLPSFIMGASSITRGSEVGVTALPSMTFGIQSVLLVIIAGYIGYRSRGLSILEPNLALAVYLAIFAIFVPMKYPFNGNSFLGPQSIVLISMFVASSISTYMGSVIRMRRELQH